MLSFATEYSRMRSLDFDVPAQGRVWGAGVSAKAQFVSEAKVEQTSQWFSLNARADRTGPVAQPHGGRRQEALRLG